MRNQMEKERCVAVIGTMTQAMQAQRVLAMASVRVEVIKAESSQTGHGCAYGIAYPCFQEQSVRNLLYRNGLTIRSFYREAVEHDLS